MRNKIWKLAMAAALLTGSLTLGLAPKPAHALGCGPICCDPDCFSYRNCFGIPGNCVCEEFCHID